MKQRGRQTGFGIIGIIVVGVAIAIIATAGWFVYQHNKPKTSGTTGSTQAANQNNNQQQNTTGTQAQADPYQDWKTYCDSTVKACIKYPSDWITSQYGGLENQACTEYASLTGPTSKDRGSDTAYIASIDDLHTPISDLKILGMVVNNKPSYSVYNASYISENNVQVGAMQEITDANYRFTGKTGDAGLVGTPCANGYTAISTLQQAKDWFNTTEGKTVLKIVQSFYYQ